MRNHISTIFYFCILLIVGCKEKQKPTNNEEEIIPVKVMNIQSSSAQTAIHASGKFSTDNETILSFKNGGIVRQLYVKEGDYVQQGQLLARVDPTEIKAMTQQADISVEKAERDYQRTKRLYLDSVATLEQMQNAETALKIARQQKVGPQFNQSTTELRATQSGYVLRKFINDGQVVAPGTPIFEINGTASGNWILEVGVSDAQWSQIKVGDDADIQTDAQPNHILKATVSKKTEGLDPNSGTFIIQLKVKDAKDFKLASGLFGKATIYPKVINSIWKIPVAALMDGDNSQGFVFSADDQKTVHKIPVTIQNIVNDSVTISHGLESTRLLITEGNAYLTEGSKIKIIH
ncbi:MAG: efflux RND transporter periplasmic adaptor subunit [Pseudopedobacter saltans]|uniref:Efflux RND transporter periplasmic adaptor subunit n=1 Tax=Pseudopedobacter saltans TaxID=151895 RepID=A0A2W5GQD3_9SPHI|nr:MAG: efflux RND transporter periplasmic adaptor subunit [Pseudopedobacter saltans]